MRRYLPIVALLVVTCAVPASAALIDPVIGVRGRDAGSEPSNTNAFFVMGTTGCPSTGNPTFCFDYEIVQLVTTVFEIELQFKDGDGNLIPNSLIFPDGTFGDNGGFNGFDDFLRLDDGFTVRLFFSEGGALQCIAGEFETVDCNQGSTIQVYLYIPENEEENSPYSVSLRSINGIAVPEPGLLLLMGIGLALAGRQLRRRRSGQPPASE